MRRRGAASGSGRSRGTPRTSPPRGRARRERRLIGEPSFLADVIIAFTRLARVAAGPGARAVAGAANSRRAIADIVAGFRRARGGPSRASRSSGGLRVRVEATRENIESAGRWRTPANPGHENPGALAGSAWRFTARRRAVVLDLVHRVSMRRGSSRRHGARPPRHARRPSVHAPRRHRPRRHPPGPGDDARARRWFSAARMLGISTSDRRGISSSPRTSTSSAWRSTTRSIPNAAAEGAPRVGTRRRDRRRRRARRRRRERQGDGRAGGPGILHRR